MTTRRHLLQGAASLIAPAEFEFGGTPEFSLSDSPFGILINEYREMLDQLDRLFAVRNRVEKIAFAQKGDGRDCSELRLIDQKANAWYQTEKEMIRLASRTRAASVDEVDFVAVSPIRPAKLQQCVRHDSLFGLSRSAFPSRKRVADKGVGRKSTGSRVGR
ncbi:hypothetical protein [Hyphococcus sp.]|uniref:hypothetical protein n=1 Tax=Hyphococcus sp. TaxID=2038636 RepID=UPI0035C73052